MRFPSMRQPSSAPQVVASLLPGIVGTSAACSPQACLMAYRSRFAVLHMITRGHGLRPSRSSGI